MSEQPVTYSYNDVVTFLRDTASVSPEILRKNRSRAKVVLLLWQVYKGAIGMTSASQMEQGPEDAAKQIIDSLAAHGFQA